MATGTVMRFSRIRGSGFIKSDDDSVAVPVYLPAIQKAGLETLTYGQKVQYELIESKNGKISAGNLKAV